MSSSASEEQINAYLDGELSAEGRLAVERAAAEDSALARRLRRERQVLDTLALAFDPVFKEQVPARLLNACMPRPWSWLQRSAAAAACLALGAAIGWNAGRLAEDSELGAPRPVSLEAATAHAVYLPEVRHPVEVFSRERDHLDRWLSKRLAHDIAAPNLAAHGFDLVGGRLLSDTGRAAAQYMYQNAAGERITIYVRPEPRALEPSALRVSENHGFRVVHWEDDQMSYAITGMLAPEQIRSLASTAHEQL